MQIYFLLSILTKNYSIINIEIHLAFGFRSHRICYIRHNFRRKCIQFEIVYKLCVIWIWMIMVVFSTWNLFMSKTWDLCASLISSQKICMRKYKQSKRVTFESRDLDQEFDIWVKWFRWFLQATDLCFVDFWLLWMNQMSNICQKWKYEIY